MMMMVYFLFQSFAQHIEVFFAKPLDEDCSYAFRIDDLMCDADTKLFRQSSDQRHCLHTLLPMQQRPKNFSPPLEVVDIVTHYHALNFHRIKTPS